MTITVPAAVWVPVSVTIEFTSHTVNGAVYVQCRGNAFSGGGNCDRCGALMQGTGASCDRLLPVVHD